MIGNKMSFQPGNQSCQQGFNCENEALKNQKTTGFTIALK